MNQLKQRPRLRPRRWFWYGTGTMLLVWALDQISKEWILSAMDSSHGYYVTSFFNLALTWNRGIAFGMFASGEVSPLILIGVAGAVSLAILFYLWRSQRVIESLGLGLILGGALGNITDRWRFGMVVDFLDFHLGGWHWPAFNLADSAICLGVMMVMVSLLWPGTSFSRITHDQ